MNQPPGDPVRDIATVLTPPGPAAIAVVRIAGRGVRSFLRQHFSRPTAPARCVHGELTDGTSVLDDPIVIAAGGGGSAEIHLHGGPWVVASTLELLRRCGFEIVKANPARPLDLEHVDGESVFHREILAHLPLARTEQGIRLLLAQVDAWNALLRDAPDERTIARIGDLGPMLFPPRVAIIGAPNVGKSTLANRLFGQERSITADLPGTTRDWVGEIANVDGLAVVLIDTPGLRQTDDLIERMAIDRSGQVVSGSELVVEVTDASAPAPPAWPGALHVLNKCDRAPQPAPSGTLQTVATTGEGIDALRAAIRARFGFEPIDLGRPMVWTSRQRDLLERARENPSVLRDIVA